MLLERCLVLPFSSALAIFPGDFQGTAIPKHTQTEKVASLTVRLTREWRVKLMGLLPNAVCVYINKYK